MGEVEIEKGEKRGRKGQKEGVDKGGEREEREREGDGGRREKEREREERERERYLIGI